MTNMFIKLDATVLKHAANQCVSIVVLWPQGTWTNPAGGDLRTDNRHLTFTRFLAADLGVEAVREGLDELEDVGASSTSSCVTSLMGFTAPRRMLNLTVPA